MLIPTRSSDVPRAGSRRLPVIATEPTRRGPDRRVDRNVTFLGLVVAAGFLALALASLALPTELRLGYWLPLHLALAGAAGTAIAAMLPFFVTALAVAPPGPAWLHGGAIALVAAGGGTVAVGRLVDPGIPGAVAVTGGALYVVGAIAVGAAAFLPLRAASGSRRRASELAYGLGLANVAVGATLASLFLAGVPEIVGAWGGLRVAHAWLNAFGFVGLVVAGTVLHFAPTVAGSRIRFRRSGVVAIAGFAAGVPATALGYATASDALVRLGAIVTVAGAAALAWHGVAAQRDRAGWTTDPEWHRFTAGSLLAAPAWLLVATALAGGRAIVAGASGTGWRLQDVLAPLVAGFVLQVLLGAITHLVPAIGPGGPDRHAAARQLLGRGGPLRLGTWNAATAALTIGLIAGEAILTAGGAAVLAVTLAATLGLFAGTLREGSATG